MTGIPYIERRRQKLYLRVRVPADIALLSGRKFVIKSLQTGDTRQARGEAARLLTRLHAGWQQVRRDVIKIAGKRLDEITGDDIPTLRASDLDGLSPDEKGTVLARIKALVDNEELAAMREQTRAAQLQASLDQHQAITSALDHENARQETMTWAQTVALVTLNKKEQQPQLRLPPEARQPWPELIDRFFTDRPSIGTSAKTSHQQAFREYEALIGAKPLCEVTKADIKAFADHLRDRPINRAGRQAMGHATIVKLLSHLKGFFGWAATSGYIPSNPADGVKPRTKTRDERDERKRRALTREELTKLFDSPLFTGCQSRTRRSTPGKSVYRDEPYWFWLIALLSGARTEEIATLPSTLVDVGGTLCLDFRHATKTSAGRRLVPVLPELLKLGIEQWAAEQARRGRGMVAGPNASGDWSKWLNRYLDDIGLDDPTVVAYSLRHNFRQRLRTAQPELHPEIVNKVFGHEGEAVGDGYGRDLEPDEAKLVKERVTSPISLEHLYPLSPVH